MSISFKQLAATITDFRADLLRVKLFLVSLERRIQALEPVPAAPSEPADADSAKES